MLLLDLRLVGRYHTERVKPMTERGNTELTLPSIDLRSRLSKCEATIERGLSTFIDVGNAIREIRDERLYRDSYVTFEDYCRQRWEWGRSHAYRHIEAAETAEAVSPMGDIGNERHARELSPLAKANPEAAQTLFSELLDEHGEKLTAKKIKQAVDARVQRDGELDRLPAEVARIVKEIDPADCDLPTSTRQLTYLAGMDDPKDQVAIARRVADGKASSVWTASTQLKEERGEITQAQVQQQAMGAAMKEEVDRRDDKEPAQVTEIRKAGNMQYVVRWSDGTASTTNRASLLGEHDYKKCNACAGYGVLRKGDRE